MQVYIDESGDAGTAGHGSRWLVFGAVLCPDSNLPELDEDLAAMEARLGRPIHCNQLPHRDIRGLCEHFGALSAAWHGVTLASDTQAAKSGLVDPLRQFNYALRYTLERVSWASSMLEEDAHVFIESRRQSPKSQRELLQYLSHLERTRAAYFNWSHFSMARVKFVQKGTLPGLCLADLLAHATFKALEPDTRWGHVERTYFDSLAGRLCRWPGNGTPLGLGLTLIPVTVHSSADHLLPGVL
jgi:hypothetical protein